MDEIVHTTSDWMFYNTPTVRPEPSSPIHGTQTVHPFQELSWSLKHMVSVNPLITEIQQYSAAAYCTNLKRDLAQNQYQGNIVRMADMLIFHGILLGLKLPYHRLWKYYANEVQRLFEKKKPARFKITAGTHTMPHDAVRSWIVALLSCRRFKVLIKQADKDYAIKKDVVCAHVAGIQLALGCFAWTALDRSSVHISAGPFFRDSILVETQLMMDLRAPSSSCPPVNSAHTLELRLESARGSEHKGPWLQNNSTIHFDHVVAHVVGMSCELVLPNVDFVWMYHVFVTLCAQMPTDIAKLVIQYHHLQQRTESLYGETSLVHAKQQVEDLPESQLPGLCDELD